MPMTEEERAAVEDFRAKRSAEFHDAANAVAVARHSGDRHAEAQARSAVRSAYREVKEAEHVLETGLLPA